MIDRILVLEPHITIHYNALDDILYADWTGEQTKDSVVDGCEKILHYLNHYKSIKVLNDNTHVTSIWSEASEWVAADWFPRMNNAGCKFFAWVYSPNIYSKLSADETLKYGIRDVITITFQHKDTAEAWLKFM